MIDFNNFEVGAFGEKECLKYVKKVKKLKILGKNVKIGHLEADIVAYDKESVIIIEVKTRREDKNNPYRPADAVDYRKQSNLIKFAYAYVSTLPKKFDDKSIRIDVCEIFAKSDGKKLVLSSLNYLENVITR